MAPHRAPVRAPDLAESKDVQTAHITLQNNFQAAPEPHGDGLAYVARGDFMPLAVLIDQDKARTPSEPESGGRCSRVVARGRYPAWATGILVPIEVRLA